MAVQTGLTRGVLRNVVGAWRIGRAVLMPWLLLVTRIWLSEHVFIHRIMMMMSASAPNTPPPLLHTALESVGPLLLATGLLTRPVALALLAEMALGLNDDVSGPQAVLLAGLAVIGPGAISLDHPLGRGLSWVPSGPVRVLHRLYGSVSRLLGPLFWLAVRVGLAGSIAASVVPALAWIQGDMPSGWVLALRMPALWTVVIAAALVLGCATRIAALVLASLIPLAGITMSMDDRFSILLLLLMLAVCGAGLISIDWLVALWAGREAGGDAATTRGLPHVVVVGGGFGGVAAVKGLRGAPCRVTLIDQRNHHLFQPLLYQVATAALSPADIATPIRGMFREQRHVRVHLGEVTGVDLEAREVLAGSMRMQFDYLVLATGARHSYFGRDEWAPFAPGLKCIEDATAIRSRLLRAFEEAENATDEAERQAWLSFVIVGGGPTGIELAGAIAELARHGLEREYRSIDPTTARVILVQSGPRVLPSFPPSLSAAAERSLRRLGVDVRLEARVRGVDRTGVRVGDTHIPARTTLWAAGVAASRAAQWLGREGDQSGRLAVGPDLSVPGLTRVYAIGDTAASLGWGGKPVPGLAPAAKQQGQYVAGLIRRALAGDAPPLPFQYRHLGSLATIGRQAAVAELGWLRISGEPAWWFWGAAHVAFLVGGRNRVTVVLDWIWAYLTYRRSTRLITGDVGGSEAAAR